MQNLQRKFETRGTLKTVEDTPIVDRDELFTMKCRNFQYQKHFGTLNNIEHMLRDVTDPRNAR